MTLQELEFFNLGVKAACDALIDVANGAKRPATTNENVVAACNSIETLRSLYVDALRESGVRNDKIRAMREEIDDLESQRQLVLTAECDDELEGRYHKKD